MKKIFHLKQKQLGIVLIIIGLLIVISVGLYWNSRQNQPFGFAQFVPDKDVVLYFEFSASLDNNSEITSKINSIFNIDWEKNIAPLVDGVAAFAFVKNSDNKKLLPLFFFKIKSQDSAVEFLTNFQSLLVDSETVFLDEETLLITSVQYKPSSSARLSENKDFIRLRQNLPGPWFVYANTKDFNPEIENLISRTVPYMPFTLPVFRAVGVSAENFNGIWQGHSYAINKNEVLVKNEQAYRALLLPFLPPDFDIIISGQNFPNQIAKMDFLAAGQGKNILSSKDFAKKEFAVAVNGDKILAIAESDEKDQGKQISFLRDVFTKNTENFTVQTRSVELQDGTKAKEFISVPAAPKTFQENFYGIEINGVLFNDKKAIYDAYTQGKLFFSNNLTVLKKSLLLTRERGLNFRDTSVYRQFFQPIFKNPELAGIVISKIGTVSFSKRMFSDHMETSFVVMLK